MFNERLLDNYNYYTSTHHSTSSKTFYLALNRLGGPRKTHIPSNKPLGKLSSYVRSMTLIVPEPRANAVLARLFGPNHVKHALKHLCASNKALHELTAKVLLVPQCSSDRTMPIATAPIRHKRPPPGPAAITEQRGHRRQSTKCTQEPCPKKNRKVIKDKAATSPAPDIKTLMSRTEPTNATDRTPPSSTKQKKKVKHKHKPKKHSPTPSISTTAATTTSTAVGVQASENLIGDEIEDEDSVDNDDLTAAEPTAISSDDNDDYGYEKWWWLSKHSKLDERMMCTYRNYLLFKVKCLRLMYPQQVLMKSANSIFLFVSLVMIHYAFITQFLIS